MGIGTKMVAVMEECRYMPKDGVNQFQHYSYTTAADMFAKINAALTAQNLFTATELTLVELRDSANAKGGTEKHAVVMAKVTVTDADSGEQVFFTGVGSGQDNGDKAVMKANTAALKYAYIGGLCIAMADDPENVSTDSFEPVIKNPPPKQNSKPPGSNELVGKCADCGKGISQNVIDYSTKKFGKPLCFECQKKRKQ